MSPEALEAKVNLMDMQSFKQIDMYGFAMVMWEVLSRCCVLTRESHDPARSHMTLLGLGLELGLGLGLGIR